MRLLLEIGYEKLLLPESANAAAILEALSQAVSVKEKREDYSQPARYALEGKLFSFQAPMFISEAQILDEDEAAEINIETLKKRNIALQQEASNATKELKALKQKVDGLQEKA